MDNTEVRCTCGYCSSVGRTSRYTPCFCSSPHHDPPHANGTHVRIPGGTVPVLGERLHHVHAVIDKRGSRPGGSGEHECHVCADGLGRTLVHGEAGKQVVQVFGLALVQLQLEQKLHVHATATGVRSPEYTTRTCISEYIPQTCSSGHTTQTRTHQNKHVTAAITRSLDTIAVRISHNPYVRDTVP